MRATWVAAGLALLVAAPEQADADCGPSCAMQLCVGVHFDGWGTARVVATDEDFVARVESIRGPLADSIAPGDTIRLPTDDVYGE